MEQRTSPVSKEIPDQEASIETPTGEAASENFVKSAVKRRIFRTIATGGLCLFAAVAFLYFAKPFLMPIVLAVLLSFLLKPAVNLFHRMHISPALGAVVVIIFFILALWIVFSNLLQPAREWVEKTPENLHRAETKIQNLIRPVTRAAERVQNIARETTEHAPQPKVPKVEVQKSPVDASFLNLASSFFMTSVETIVLVYFFLAMGEKLTSSFVNALSAARNKQKAVEITHELQKNISAFLFTISCINVGFGVLVGFGAMLVGMPNALLWGAMAAILNFIPYFGPLTGVVVLAIAGFVTFDTIGHALLTPAIYLALHAVESNFFTPLLLGRRLTMNPVMIFISLMFWTWLWGIPGALLSVPLLAMIKIICDHFKTLRPISEFIAGEEKRKKLRFG